MPSSNGLDYKAIAKCIANRACVACLNYGMDRDTGLSICKDKYKIVYKDSGCDKWVNFHEKKSQTSCHPEELKKWIHFVWREMREQNSTVPDDVLDFIKEASLNAIGEK